MKKIVIMAALSFATASAMAASMNNIDTSTITSTSGVLSVTGGTSVTSTISIDPMTAGKHSSGEEVATLKSSETGAPVSAIAMTGDYNAPGYNDDSMSWDLVGSNSATNVVHVQFRGRAIGDIVGKFGTDHNWIATPHNTSEDRLLLNGDQTLAADSYNVNLYAAAFLN
ncbi:MAG: hypothetical protein JO002_17685 [Burkholderiaceae bacterium]|nr:hypothetical protein [Burkholderiaceae bacterium]